MVRCRKPPSQTWRTFLENHAKQLVSVDFFTVPTIRFQTLSVFPIPIRDSFPGSRTSSKRMFRLKTYLAASGAVGCDPGYEKLRAEVSLLQMGGDLIGRLAEGEFWVEENQNRGTGSA